MSALVYHERGCKIFAEGSCTCIAGVELCEGQSPEDLEKAKLLYTYFQPLAQVLEEWKALGEDGPLADRLEEILDQMQDEVEALIRQSAILKA